MSVTLSLRPAPLPILWGLPSPPSGWVASGMDWTPLDPDGGPPQELRRVIVEAAMRLGRLAYLGDPPSTGILSWTSPVPAVQVTDDPIVAESAFDGAAWSQQEQAMAVLAAGAAPDAKVLYQATPARGGNVAGLCEPPSVLLILLPAIDGAAVGMYARGDAAAAWHAALADRARTAGFLLSGTHTSDALGNSISNPPASELAP